MVLKRAAVKRDFLNSGRLQSLGNCPAHSLCGGFISAIRNTEVFFAGAGSRQSPPRQIVNRLHVNVLMTAEDAESRPLSNAANAFAHAPTAALPLLQDGAL